MPGPSLIHVGLIKLNLFMVYHVLSTSTSLSLVLKKHGVLVLTFEYLTNNSNIC
jgi:hypothetical protein